MTVTYRLEPTGVGQQVRERVLTTRCPTCDADWTVRGNGLPRHGSGREVYCTGCGTFHRATKVDEHGTVVPSPGWGVTQQHRRDSEGGPAATHEG